MGCQKTNKINRKQKTSHISLLLESFYNVWPKKNKIKLLQKIIINNFTLNNLHRPRYMCGTFSN